MNYTWPTYYPAGCPPQEALIADRFVYRFVKGNPVTMNDFVTHTQRWPEKDYPNPCKASGISIGTNLAEMKKAQGEVPGMNKKRIAIGYLGAEDGLIINTPSEGWDWPSHHTWWSPIGCDHVACFCLLFRFRNQDEILWPIAAKSHRVFRGLAIVESLGSRSSEN